MTANPKGSLVHVNVVLSPTIEYGVPTEWAVQLVFQSPTGDSSDFIYREIPCIDQAQANEIRDQWLRFIGKAQYFVSEAPTNPWSKVKGIPSALGNEGGVK